MSIDQIQELKSIIMNFRVSELNQLLQFCNQSKVGRKPVLQERALGLLKKDTLTQQIQFKIRELSYLQTGTSNKSTSSSIPDIPLAQDSSSNECTITEMNMLPIQVNQRIQKAIQNHFSMPKLNQFDLKNLNHNQTVKSYTTNVQFKPIPFDDFVSSIIDPTVLSSPLNKKGLNNYECSFKLKSEQASEISLSREFKAGKLEFNSQIHLRFCLAESYTPQDDHLPLNLTIRLNNKNIQLPSVIPNNKPNVESKRQSKPIDLTPFSKLSPVSSNQLSIQWNQDVNSVSSKNYCFMIYLVKKLTSKDLLDKLNQKGVADSILTQKLIISKLSDNDNEISTTSLKGNLNCPLGKMRLRIPVRSTQCSHIQCFDAELYLQMNEKKPSWLCPVCDKKAEYNTLFIDGLFTQILKETSTDSNEIEFSEDGSWKIIQNLNKTIVLTPQRRKIDEDTSCIKKSKTEEEEVIELSSDSDDDNENVLQPIHMPKLNSFNDATKSINSVNNPFSSSNQFSTSSLNNNASRNQITRSNGSNFGSGFTLSTYHSTSNGSLNENNSNSTMLRGRILNSEPNVISLD